MRLRWSSILENQHRSWIWILKICPRQYLNTFLGLSWIFTSLSFSSNFHNKIRKSKKIKRSRFSAGTCLHALRSNFMYTVIRVTTVKFIRLQLLWFSHLDYLQFFLKIICKFLQTSHKTFNNIWKFLYRKLCRMMAEIPSSTAVGSMAIVCLTGVKAISIRF